MGTVDTGTSAVIPQPYTLPGGKAEVFCMTKFIAILYDPVDLIVSIHMCQSMELVRSLHSMYDKLLAAGFKLRVYKLQEV